MNWPFKMKGFFMFKYKHGFCIIRCQPFHIGHDRLIKKMMEECENGTVLIASAQESGTLNNPLPYFTRKKMIQNVWRKSEAYNRLRIIGVKDTNTTPWNIHVLETIKKEQPELEVPDIIYVGNLKEYAYFANDIKNSGLKSFACVVDCNALPITEAKFCKGSIVLIGNEANGLTDDTVNSSDYKITIPMNGTAESLNASVAAAIAAWEMMK